MFTRFLSQQRRFALVCALLSIMFVHATAAPLAVRPGVQDGPVVTLPDGTDFTVVVTEEIDSKTATEGDPISFRVDDDVKIGDRIVIASGATVKGTISEAEKSGRMGKAGKLSIRVESTNAVDGQRIRLRAAKGKSGDDKAGSTIALALIVSPLFLLRKGKNAKIKEGTKITVYTDDEVKVRTKA